MTFLFLGVLVSVDIIKGIVPMCYEKFFAFYNGAYLLDHICDIMLSKVKYCMEGSEQIEREVIL